MNEQNKHEHIPGLSFKITTFDTLRSPSNIGHRLRRPQLIIIFSPPVPPPPNTIFFVPSILFTSVVKICDHVEPPSSSPIINHLQLPYFRRPPPGKLHHKQHPLLRIIIIFLFLFPVFKRCFLDKLNEEQIPRAETTHNTQIWSPFYVSENQSESATLCKFSSCSTSDIKNRDIERLQWL
ncbi:hypothetical protein HanRHA438_Chr13g0604291 [Helianthus annuus]|nr:hypothetical protein HanRHA438_Chr13g0604291 [Helianthus annuus]